MEYKYTKYPVNVDQLSDEILASINIILTKINEQDIVNGEISYSDANVQNNLTITIDESLSQDMENTLNTLISNHIPKTKYNSLDWARRRDVILPQFYMEAGSQLENFSSLSTKKKMIACDFFLIPYNIRLMFVTNEQDSKNWEFLLKKTKESRKDCIEAMRLKTGEYMRTGQLTLVQTQLFYKDVFDYINWFEDANAPDFKQWLTNEVGSAYENNGFEQASYYSSQLKTDLMDIYNGNY